MAPSEAKPVGVNIRDVIDLTASKSAMYRALTVYGKHSPAHFEKIFRSTLPAAEASMRHRLPQAATHGREALLPQPHGAIRLRPEAESPDSQERDGQGLRHSRGPQVLARLPVAS